jgi:hypothetical protein
MSRAGRETWRTPPLSKAELRVERARNSLRMSLAGQAEMARNPQRTSRDGRKTWRTPLLSKAELRAERARNSLRMSLAGQAEMARNPQRTSRDGKAGMARNPLKEREMKQRLWIGREEQEWGQRVWSQVGMLLLKERPKRPMGLRQQSQPVERMPSSGIQDQFRSHPQGQI